MACLRDQRESPQNSLHMILQGSHKFSEPLQRNPRLGLEYIGALGQKQHVSCALSVQRRSLSSLMDSAVPKGKGKQSFPQKNAPLSSEGQARDFDQQDENTNSGFPPYPAGESSQFVTREKLRHCMRRVPQSVAIITARDINDPQNAWRGATVSSFTTVTFEPEVIVSLNLKLPSTTYDAILSSNRFDINMLKADDKGAELASRFASPLEEARRKAFAVEERPRSSSLTFHPLFSRSHGAKNPVAFRIPCCYMPEKTVQIGDHVVIFGKAEAIERKSYDSRAGETTTCLAYIDGCYGYVVPLSKQPKRESTGLSSNKNRDAPIRVAKQSPISRKDFLAFVNHAQECASCFKGSFFSDVVHLGCINRRTLLLVREVRLHSAEVHNAILRLSKAVPKDGIEDLVLDPSTSANECPPILSENDKSNMLTRGSCPSANGPLDRTRFKTGKSKLAVSSVPTPMMPSPSPLITPFREFSSTRTVSQRVKNINHRGRSSKSSNSIEVSMKPMVRGTLRLPAPKSMKTVVTQYMESVSVTASANSGNLDQSVVNTNPTDTVKNHVSVKLPRVKRVGGIKIYPLIRPGFVDYPPFRKIFTNELATHRTEPLAGHQQVCLRSRKKKRDRISNGDRDEISTPIKRVFIRKHLVYDNRFLPLLASPIQARSSSGTTTEHAKDIEAPIKVHLYRSALRIRKQLTTNKWDDQSDVPFPSHMSEEFDQEQRENIESAMQEALVGQQTPGQAVLEDIAFRQHRKIQEPGRNQNMERDIEGVMGQIQDYFQREFGTAAVLRENIESAMQENPPGQQTSDQVLTEKIALRQQKTMQKLARNKAMERDIKDVMAQIQDYFQRRSGTAAT
ncbi:hypothetical protein EPUS_07244 [Endocarpon pusillum Z07020]|uniref:Flavin reductase like domain-containing protein n=1 Tax=Endocarpon pusillum (strain Z07020 / HMAS-L-300199) TaxID=1263415 RepID=U1FVB4_ENDPU|nr:uncharacterized protein EPUS_07244 [Endocarpon pusillum Z07020]ERF68757.1 hypothetical protein EPUS_07244 [Endocarpon pusillum Z07020]